MPALKRRSSTVGDDVRGAESFPLLGKRRGWDLSAEHLGQLAHHAKDTRRDPTEPEKRLWTRLAHAQLGGHKFHRQPVIGPFIADFLCPQRALIVEVDSDTHNVQSDLKRDAALNAVGFSILRFGDADVTRNLDGVCETILRALEQAPDRWANSHPSAETRVSVEPSPVGRG